MQDDKVVDLSSNYDSFIEYPQNEDVFLENQDQDTIEKQNDSHVEINKKRNVQISQSQQNIHNNSQHKNLENQFDNSQIYLISSSPNKSIQQSIYDNDLSYLYRDNRKLDSLGYGDIFPASNIERLFCIAITLIACGIFAYAVNMIGTIFQEKAQKEAGYNKKKFIAQQFMEIRNISQTQQVKVLKYLEYQFEQDQKQGNIQKGQDVLLEIPKNIREEVLMEFYSNILMKCKVLKRTFSKKFIQKLSLKMREIQLCPQEELYKSGQISDENCDYYVENIEQYFNDLEELENIEHTDQKCSQTSFVQISQNSESFSYLNSVSDQSSQTLQNNSYISGNKLNSVQLNSQNEAINQLDNLMQKSKASLQAQIEINQDSNKNWRTSLDSLNQTNRKKSSISIQGHKNKQQKTVQINGIREKSSDLYSDGKIRQKAKKAQFSQDSILKPSLKQIDNQNVQNLQQQQKRRKSVSKRTLMKSISRLQRGFTLNNYNNDSYFSTLEQFDSLKEYAHYKTYANYSVILARLESKRKQVFSSVFQKKKSPKFAHSIVLQNKDLSLFPQQVKLQYQLSGLSKQKK
ncbi:Cyclic nucleotide-binding protein [Pseudocohnilembus persalinus]|uniref:Cyclic nucleotide-binding protein n=1 Tax=Pseudocohnilembus persalinus TaxID=266149 RepID=A0A0V0QMJ4_PSEPJ|nr:Cyclic nucleotide-binding protein [Pseudocohnilembus persalinus]|eukprot:KRX03437.1 Cyclic nucleotide-binding protein [Pseudocohnilembus persalinus]